MNDTEISIKTETPSGQNNTTFSFIDLSSIGSIKKPEAVSVSQKKKKIKKIKLTEVKKFDPSAQYQDLSTDQGDQDDKQTSDD